MKNHSSNTKYKRESGHYIVKTQTQSLNNNMLKFKSFNITSTGNLIVILAPWKNPAFKSFVVGNNLNHHCTSHDGMVLERHQTTV